MAILSTFGCWRILLTASMDIPGDGIHAGRPMALIAIEPARAGLAATRVEEQLVERARAKDVAAWDAIYTTHYAAIFNYVWFRVVDQEAAEDIAAEVFVEALRGIGRYRYRGVPFRAWLYRIARNLTIDARRKQLAAAFAESPIPDGFELPEEGDFVVAVGRREDLRRAIAGLTEDQQLVVTLRFFVGLSLSETAATLGRREGAVKALQHRALGRMRSLLSDDVEGFDGAADLGKEGR